MKLFLLVNIALLVFCIVGKLSMLALGDMPKRTPVTEVLDVLVNGALLVWAAVLLVNL